MRKIFGQTMIELARQDKNIHLIVGDVGFDIFEKYIKEFPDRYHNFGILEQSMIGVASGMALEGLKPYVYAITPFLIERACEAIKLDIYQQNVNVKLVGYADYPNQGPTHSCLNEKIFIEMFKNQNNDYPSELKSYFPIDSKDTQKIIMESYKYEGPFFISLKQDKKV